jgi:excinuclease UvrABC nuclease subunit
MKDKFFNFLLEEKIMPIEKPFWNCFEIEHRITPCDDLATIRNFLREQTQSKNGLYAYKDHEGNLLYIGKGKPIKDRLYSHFIESYKQVPGDRSGKWHRFFYMHSGNLKVYWIELEDESIRKFVEHVLTDEYNPKFLFLKNRLQLETHYVKKNKSVSNHRDGLVLYRRKSKIECHHIALFCGSFSVKHNLLLVINVARCLAEHCY